MYEFSIGTSLVRESPRGETLPCLTSAESMNTLTHLLLPGRQDKPDIPYPTLFLLGIIAPEMLPSLQQNCVFKRQPCRPHYHAMPKREKSSYYLYFSCYYMNRKHWFFYTLPPLFTTNKPTKPQPPPFYTQIYTHKQTASITIYEELKVENIVVREEIKGAQKMYLSDCVNLVVKYKHR